MDSEVMWFYEIKGERKGPFSQDEMVNFIQHNQISYGVMVWKKGYPDWIKIEASELKDYIFDLAPPPLTGKSVSNAIVWILAFAPILSDVIRALALGFTCRGNDYCVLQGFYDMKYWWITLVLNIGLGIFDEKKLEKAGVDTTKFSFWVWLVPVYLYQRANALKHNLAYFIVWIVCFVLSLIISAA
ncbi:DUF4339 domain-containing protein [Pasteurellaceae bacterium HPA106]|uniref:DUF4339 domain-containing protein n=1 Tax=Spirabiliibacterium pneumoniae TaxID=221400 RepID=UPI001AADF8EE|nr:DUF4339 domain-containing protein [Spirabiliibacterium pneumoniae]MBE2895806.1 DUF4339 domain-containing protein [Spirabiliibacterium pneumoniae]